MNFFNEAKEKVSSAGAAASEKVSEAASAVKDNLPSDIGALKDMITNQAKAFADEKMEMLKKFEQEKKQQIRAIIQRKLEALFDHSMNVVGEHLKENIKDPYMPMFVQNFLDDLVDGIWPDVKLEVKDTVLTGAASEMLIDHGQPPWCIGYIPAAIRYLLFPYDRSVWRQLRNPLFIIFLIASVFPKWGVSQITYILLFLFLDMRDEFQLQQYVIKFKSLQFISLGVLSAIIGAVQYYICISETPMTCDDVAPKEEMWSLLLFVLQVVVVWIAFILMGSSKKKGGFFYQMSEDEKKQVHNSAGTTSGRTEALNNISGEKQGDVLHQMRMQNEEELLERSRGRLVGYLIYDLIVFILCLGLVAWVAFNNQFDSDAQIDVSDKDTLNNWKFSMSLYWIKALYGLLSFPFIILKLPVISTFISHAKPTGYNPYGNTVPFLGVEEERPVPWDPNRRRMVVEDTRSGTEMA